MCNKFAFASSIKKVVDDLDAPVSKQTYPLTPEGIGKFQVVHDNFYAQLVNGTYKQNILILILMKSLLTLIFFLLAASSGFCQKVQLLTIDRMNERIEQGKDTIYVVNFWATWCAPCIKELPHFEKLQQDKRREKLKVLLVSLDFKSRLEKSVVPFVKKRGLKNEIFLLDETDQQVYIDRIDKSWSGAIPATLFVKGGKRKFVEKEYTYNTLLTEYQNFK